MQVKKSTLYIHIIQVVPYYGCILRGNTKKTHKTFMSSSMPHDEIRRKIGMLRLTVSTINNLQKFETLEYRMKNT